jgi:hypothetical protein
MDEFTMSATALYAEGRPARPFAEVSARTLITCFGAMALEVWRWLAATLAAAEKGTRPKAIELTLRWGGPTAPAPVPQLPEVSGNGDEVTEPPSGPEITRAVRRRSGCSRSRRLLRPARALAGRCAPVGA